VSLIAALASGLAPALQASRADVLTSLNTDVQGPSRRSRLRHAFVIAQIACSLLLAVLAGLFVRALHQAGAVDPGYDPKGVELATLDLSMGHYTDASGARFSHDLLDRVRQIPGVQAATVAKVLPGGFEEMRLSGLTTPGYEPADGEKIIFPAFYTIEPGYFATIRLPLVSGRDFADTDVAAAQRVIIVSENLARRFFPGQDAVGKYITPNPNFGPPLLVVGVARDIKSSSLIDGRTRPAVYVPMQQQYAKGWPQITIAARSATGRRMPDELRDAVHALDPGLPIVRARTLEEEAAMGLVLPGIVASVAGTLGSIGMLLAAIGLYGVTAYTVARRSREIGIRIALGARSGQIATMVVAQALWLAAIGSAIGLGLGALVGRALAGFLFGVPPLDPPAFIGAALLFATIASIASYIPARRAIRVDPLTALRHD
jgi:putative ABC transport system permease protein